MTSPQHERTLLEKLEELGAEVRLGLAKRLKLTRLLRRSAVRPVWAAFTIVNSFIAIALLAALTMVSDTPFVLPSLGADGVHVLLPPEAPATTPRNALCGHALGILCGYGALLLTGLEDSPSGLAERVHRHACLLLRCPWPVERGHDPLPRCPSAGRRHHPASSRSASSPRPGTRSPIEAAVAC